MTNVETKNWRTWRLLKTSSLFRHSNFVIRTSLRYTHRLLSDKNIAIFTAVRIETRAIKNAIKPGSAKIYTIGIGAGHLPNSFEMRGVSTIILCGLAGALDPALKVGDLVLDDPRHLLPPAAPFPRGAIHSASRIIDTPAEKARLFHETRAAAVDMEQAKVQQFAVKFGIPFLSIRAISDSAQEVLDPRVMNFVNELGDPQRAKIAITLIRQPRLISYLTRLNASTKLALGNLAPAVRAIVKNLNRSM